MTADRLAERSLNGKVGTGDANLITRAPLLHSIYSLQRGNKIQSSCDIALFGIRNIYLQSDHLFSATSSLSLSLSVSPIPSHPISPITSSNQQRALPAQSTSTRRTRNMARPRRSSAASEESTVTARDQELGSMYDYLAKIILLGPSGTGKSCLLHRFVKSEWRVLSSQTIGVEFATKIIKVGTGARRKRIKLQVSQRLFSVPSALFRAGSSGKPCADTTSHSFGTQPAPSASAPSRAPTTAAPPVPSSSTTSPRPRPSTTCSPSSMTRARWPRPT